MAATFIRVDCSFSSRSCGYTREITVANSCATKAWQKEQSHGGERRINQQNWNFPNLKLRRGAEEASWIDKQLNQSNGIRKFTKRDQEEEQSARAVRVEQLWQEVFSDPSQWWDNQLVKKNSKYPDFKHKVTHEGLWIEGALSPSWVKEKLAALEFGPFKGMKSRSQVLSSLRADESVRKLCEEGRLREALHTIDFMALQNIQVPFKTLACLLRECTRKKALNTGKQVHALIFQLGLDSNLFLGNTLINMYAKCGSILDARRVFDLMPEHNLFSWTTIITAYANHEQAEEALNIFQQMQEAGIPPNKVTYVVLVKACSKILALERGKQLHMDIIRSGVELDVMIGSALVDMYAKCGCIEDACRVFNNMHERDLVSWNAMIMGYAHHDLGVKALSLYEQMKEEGVQANNVTFIALLKACGSIPSLEDGKQLHLDIMNGGFDSDVTVRNTLVYMYSKCGCIEAAQQVFDSMYDQTVVSWNAMIAGYAQQGLGKEALTLFEQMRRQTVKPNELTYVSILSACSHSGLLDEGCSIFASMCQDDDVTLTTDHYACMIDILGRRGFLTEAEDLIHKMPIQPNVLIWMTLLGAARFHGNVKIGRRAFDRVVELEPDNSAAYVLLSNIYATAECEDCNKESELRAKHSGG